MASACDPDGSRIYVLAAGAEGLYKIGRTSAPLERRVAHLNTGAALKLRLVASFGVARDSVCKCEAYVHASLHDLAAKQTGGAEFFRCEQEEQICARVRGACEAFARFQEGIARALGSSRGCEILELFKVRGDLAAQVKVLELQKELLERELKLTFGEGFEHEAQPLLSWTKRSSCHFDLDAFKREHPALYAQYSAPRSVRVARFH